LDWTLKKRGVGIFLQRQTGLKGERLPFTGHLQVMVMGNRRSRRAGKAVGKKKKFEDHADKGDVRTKRQRMEKLDAACKETKRGRSFERPSTKKNWPDGTSEKSRAKKIDKNGVTDRREPKGLGWKPKRGKKMNEEGLYLSQRRGGSVGSYVEQKKKKGDYPKCWGKKKNRKEPKSADD